MEVRRFALSVATADLKLYDLHFEECDLCHETYCSMCFLFHMDQPHGKADKAVTKDSSERRIVLKPSHFGLLALQFIADLNRTLETSGKCTPEIDDPDDQVLGRPVIL